MRKTVAEVRSRLKINGHASHGSHSLTGGTLAAGAYLDLLDAGIGKVVGVARGHVEQMAHENGTFCRLGIRAGGGTYTNARKFGQIVAYGVGHDESAAFHEAERRRTGDDLCAGVHVVKLVTAYGDSGFHVGVSRTVAVEYFVVARHGNIHAGKAPRGERINKFGYVSEVVHTCFLP